ncbi:light-regulated protein, chloroplastic [Telopea speciosissima]|uniref:light-regulated protein, chloroplastic n=1 Tax=Telopea speciosissima TaxID=54955 RepID=UPI001CC71EAD|nr:light-regulated protein, chloroplastic [Telopea speciosissima]
MLTALCITPSVPTLIPTKISVATLPRSSPKLLQSSLVSRCPSIKAASSVANDTSAVIDYSSMVSVFPAEACETIGGEACAAEMYPEVKIKTEDGNDTVAKTVPEMVDREYFEYNDPKTVFPGEACDDLGGEFCEADYQKGVY